MSHALHTAHSADDTRERLLDVAEELFAKSGFAAVSVREITAAASCNVAAVNYHFGGKEALYLEVFRRRLKALREHRIGRIRDAMEGPRTAGDPTPVLRAFAAAFLEPLEPHSSGRRAMQLMMQEMLNPHLPPGMLWEEMFDPVRSSLAQALVAIVPELGEDDALRCAHSVIGQLVHAIHVRRAGEAKTDLPAMQEHIVRYSVGGLFAFRGGWEKERIDAED